MKDGSALAVKVPPVADRAALLRVYLSPGAGYVPHPIQAQLTLETQGASTVLPVNVSPAAASTEGALNSTINFQIAAGVIKADTKFSVALREKSGSGSNTSEDARWPKTDTLAPPQCSLYRFATQGRACSDGLCCRRLETAYQIRAPHKLSCTRIGSPRFIRRLK